MFTSIPPFLSSQATLCFDLHKQPYPSIFSASLQLPIHTAKPSQSRKLHGYQPSHTSFSTPAIDHPPSAYPAAQIFTKTTKTLFPQTQPPNSLFELPQHQKHSSQAHLSHDSINPSRSLFVPITLSCFSVSLPVSR